MKRLLGSLFVSLVMLAGILVPQASAASTQCNTYVETGQTVCDNVGFLSYWLKNGGVPVFGFPISGELQEKNPDTGQILTVQYFERARFEYHPENPEPYKIELGRFGDEILRLNYANVDTMEAWRPDTGQGEFFDTTGHNVGGFADGSDVANIFDQYWHSHGLDLGDPGISFRESLALFGYPLTDVFDEQQADGSIYQVQYFERARFEYHPALRNSPYVVLLGLFGDVIYKHPTPGNCLPLVQLSVGRVLVPLGAGGTTMYLRDSRIGFNATNQLLVMYFTPTATGTFMEGNLRITFLEFPNGCRSVGSALIDNAKVNAIVNPDYANIVGPFFH